MLDIRFIPKPKTSLRTSLTADDLQSYEGGEVVVVESDPLKNEKILAELERVGLSVEQAVEKYPDLLEKSKEEAVEFTNNGITIPNLDWKFQKLYIKDTTNELLNTQIIPSLLVMNPGIKANNKVLIKYIQGFGLRIGSTPKLDAKDIENAILRCQLNGTKPAMSTKSILFMKGSMLSASEKISYALKAVNKRQAKAFEGVVNASLEKAIIVEHKLLKITDSVLLRNCKGIKDIKTLRKHKTEVTQNNQDTTNKFRPLKTDKVLSKYLLFSEKDYGNNASEVSRDLQINRTMAKTFIKLYNAV